MSAAASALPSHLRLTARQQAAVAALVAHAAAGTASTHSASGAPTWPLYLYDLTTVRERATALADAVRSAAAAVGVASPALPHAADLPPPVLLYAMKANSLPAVVQAILGCGFGVDCVSLGELQLALRLGAPRILFTNNNVCDEEFAAAVQLAAAHPDRVWINCDSIQRISDLPRGAQCFVRVNGPVGGGHHDHVITCGPTSKFGVPHELIPDALAAAEAAGVRIVGLHQHIGSGVLDVDRFCSAVDVLAGVLQTHAASLPHVQFVNFGGGIGVPYRPDQEAIDLPTLATAVVARFATLCSTIGRQLTLVLEPGRFPVAQSGFLMARVNTLKDTPYKRTYVGIETGFNHLVRPTMYGSYHHITNWSSAQRGSAAAPEPWQAYYVAGNVCESGDVFTRHNAYSDAEIAREVGTPTLPAGAQGEEENAAGARLLQRVQRGDVLLLHTAGAYGASMSSEYNMRPRAAEVILDDAERLAATGNRAGDIVLREHAATLRVARAQMPVSALVDEMMATL